MLAGLTPMLHHQLIQFILGIKPKVLRLKFQHRVLSLLFKCFDVGFLGLLQGACSFLFVINHFRFEQICFLNHNFMFLVSVIDFIYHLFVIFVKNWLFLDVRLSSFLVFFYDFFLLPFAHLLRQLRALIELLDGHKLLHILPHPLPLLKIQTIANTRQSIAAIDTDTFGVV